MNCLSWIGLNEVIGRREKSSRAKGAFFENMNPTRQATGQSLVRVVALPRRCQDAAMHSLEHLDPRHSAATTAFCFVGSPTTAPRGTESEKNGPLFDVTPQHARGWESKAQGWTERAGAERVNSSMTPLSSTLTAGSTGTYFPKNA